MEIDCVKTSDGKGYQFSLYGNMKSNQFRKQLKNTSSVLSKKFQKVIHKVRKENNVEHHVYQAYGYNNQRRTQMGGGIYFSYVPGMSDMSCYIVAHLKNHKNGLWQFMGAQRRIAKKYCDDLVIPHITLYEYHINCELFRCPENRLDPAQDSWVTTIANYMCLPTYNFLFNSILTVKKGNRYSILGMQESNKFIAMLLQQQTVDGQDLDIYVDNYRQELLTIIATSLNINLNLCDGRRGSPDFQVYCDSEGNEAIAVPKYHTTSLLPHVSLGTITKSVDKFRNFDHVRSQHSGVIPEEFREFDYEYNPARIRLFGDIRYIEISFKNQRLNFFHHYVYDLATGFLHSFDDSEYEAFKQQNLEIIP